MPGRHPLSVRVERATVAITVALSMVAITLVGVLQTSVDRTHERVADVNALSTAISRQMVAPLAALSDGSQPADVDRIARGGRRIRAMVTALGQNSALPGLNRAIDRTLDAEQPALRQLAQAAADPRSSTRDGSRMAAVAALGDVQRTYPALTAALDRVQAHYDSRDAAAHRRAQLGSAGAIGLMLVAFLIVYQRSVRTRGEAERLAEENAALASLNEQDAATDALTGLGNRRALLKALAAACDGCGEQPVMLALFDLDGFKLYNDVYGHPAGDALLQRLGTHLVASLPEGAHAYRMGGDEFCVLATVERDDAVSVAQAAAEALTDRGERFEVSASHGIAVAPADADVPADLLRVADQRMYANKAARSGTAASRQATDVLGQMLTEQDAQLAEHGDDVAALVGRVAERLGMTSTEARHAELAARLHDIGKCAMPTSMLAKPGPLDDEEWTLMRQHTVIGERIVNAAPAISHVAPLIRSSHERVDGTGYPDGLCGEEIPLGARVIAVCDAFHAMTNGRVYREPRGVEEAIAELRRCAGTQFDPGVVATFVSVVAAEPDRAATA